MAPYKSQRSRNLFDPASDKPFKLSRSKIDLFLNCPRCFYIDRRLGTGQPPGYPFNLNSAVDHLLKKEFDRYRALGEPHPLMIEYGVDAIPYQSTALDQWRDNFKGVQVLHEPTNLCLTGAVDDVWINPAGELIVVDYKSTSKNGEITVDADWQIGYRRQMEFYQWLLRGNGFHVSTTGYFVYANGDKSKPGFNGRLEFTTKLIPYDGRDAWVEPALCNARACLAGDEIPAPGGDCDYCAFQRAVQGHLDSRPRTAGLRIGNHP